MNDTTKHIEIGNTQGGRVIKTNDKIDLTKFISNPSNTPEVIDQKGIDIVLDLLQNFNVDEVEHIMVSVLSNICIILKRFDTDETQNSQVFFNNIGARTIEIMNTSADEVIDIVKQFNNPN